NPTSGAYALFGDITNSNNLFVTDSANLYFSSNGGAAFTNRYTSANPNGLWIAGAFFNGSNIYVGTNDGLLVSSNDGTSFALSSVTGLSGEMASFTGATNGATTTLFCVTVTAGTMSPGCETCST